MQLRIKYFIYLGSVIGSFFMLTVCAHAYTVNEVDRTIESFGVEEEPYNVEVEHWDNGNIRLATEYNELGKKTKVIYCRTDGTPEQMQVFTGSGNRESTAYYSSSGSLRTGPDGWAAIIWHYDGGVMRGQGYYNASGSLTRYQVYSPSGDLVNKIYVGDNEPELTELYSNSKSTSRRQSFEFYDSYGRPQGKTSSYKYTGWFPLYYPYGYPFASTYYTRKYRYL